MIRGLLRKPGREATRRRLCPHVPFLVLLPPHPALSLILFLRIFLLFLSCPPVCHRSSEQHSPDRTRQCLDSGLSKVSPFSLGTFICCWALRQENKDSSVCGCAWVPSFSPFLCSSLIALSDHPATPLLSLMLVSSEPWKRRPVTWLWSIDHWSL